MSDESGAVGVIAVALAALTLVLGLMMVDVARLVAMRAQLATAADAAALAAAPVTFAAFGTSGDPTQAATRIAVANGAELTDCACRVDRSWEPRIATATVQATVRLTLFGDKVLMATAAAEFRPIALGQR